jgi:hypothetical protein
MNLSFLVPDFLKRAGDPMIRPAELHSLLAKQEFVPQAIVATDVDYFAERFGATVVQDSDNLDGYIGVGYLLDALPFTVMHYRGHPDGTATIYLPQDISDVDKITAIIGQIASAFDLPNRKVQWQRKDNPEL